MSNPSSRAKANKRKGSAWEIDKENYWLAKGFECHRLRLSGKDDQGDLLVKVNDLLYVVFENKNEKSIDLSRYTEEALKEAMAWEAKHVHQIDPAALVMGMWDVKRRMKGVGDSYVGTSSDEFASLLLHLQQG